MIVLGMVAWKPNTKLRIRVFAILNRIFCLARLSAPVNGSLANMTTFWVQLSLFFNLGRDNFREWKVHKTPNQFYK